MKNCFVLCFGMVLFLALKSTGMSGQTPGTGISGTFHDLSMTTGRGNTYGDSLEQAGEDRICVYCHAPHHTLKEPSNLMTYLPLWNHEPGRNTIFIMYWFGKNLFERDEPVSRDMIREAAPGGVSLLCLSCHDGSVAINAYGFNPSSSRGSGVGPPARGRILIGGGTGDLRNHHPIGFAYNDAAATNLFLRPSTTALRGVNSFGLTIDDLLWNGRVECVTCHDVHNMKNGGTKFTMVQDRRSEFCLSCHIK